MFTIISAIAKNGEIGKNNSLLWNLPEDLKYFRQVTMNSKIVMGRKTYESLPKRLDNREYFIVTRDCNFYVEDATIVNDLDLFIKENNNTDEEIFVIGGGSIYKYFLPYVKKMYITKVNKSYPDADCYFPIFDKEDWNERFLYTNFQNWIFFEHFIFNKN